VRYFLLFCLFVACAPPDAEGGPSGDSEDRPNVSAADACAQRRLDVLKSAEHPYTDTAIRWSCADVPGVNTNQKDDRGQEYCEYFALVQLPGTDKAQVLGRAMVTPLQLSPTDADALDAAPDQIVGQCVFTSWHEDVPGPLPACTTSGCPTVMGWPLDEILFRMTFQFNSNHAANSLLAGCFKPGQPWTSNSDPLRSDYYRGCMNDPAPTEWRKSDPTICAAAMRLDECGCHLPDGSSLANALIPPQPGAGGNVTLRGFPLASWSNPQGLTSGCQYAQTGDDSHTVVLCQLTANDVLQNANDVKRACHDKYADSVVVHVPIPKSALICEPDRSTPAGMSCSATPWVVDN
jgi:hypothetical protein